MTDWIDSHIHFTDFWSLEEIDSLILRAEENHVNTFLNVCGDEKSLQKGFELQKKHPGVFLAAATTPHDVEKGEDLSFSFFQKCAREKKLIAIGETGLEYFHQGLDKKKQRELFEKYLKLAEECHLPVLIHCREAFEDLFSILKSETKVLLHCFSGGMKEAQIALDRGWSLSFSGVITYPKNEALREVVKNVPLERLFIETDAPFLAPVPHRGKGNEPAYLVETAKQVAQIKGISLDECAKILQENFFRFFLFKK